MFADARLWFHKDKREKFYNTYAKPWKFCFVLFFNKVKLVWKLKLALLPAESYAHFVFNQAQFYAFSIKKESFFMGN